MLVDERDTFLAENIRRHADHRAGPPPLGLAQRTPRGLQPLGDAGGVFAPRSWPAKLVAVVGAGHVPGIVRYWHSRVAPPVPPPPPLSPPPQPSDGDHAAAADGSGGEPAAVPAAPTPAAKTEKREPPADLAPLLEVEPEQPWDRTQCNALGCTLCATTVATAYGSVQGLFWLRRHGPPWWAQADDRQRTVAAVGAAVGLLAAYRWCCGGWPCGAALGCGGGNGGGRSTLLEEAREVAVKSKAETAAAAAAKDGGADGGR